MTDEDEYGGGDVPQPGLREFRRRVLLFFLPVVAVLGLFESALWWSGEAYPAAWIVTRQQRQPSVRYLRGLMDQQFGGFKSIAIQALRPRILAVGSSRVMQFTAPMFGEGAGFYNFGGGVQTVSDLTRFAERIAPAVKPEVVIVGVEVWWFNEHVTGAGTLDEQIELSSTVGALQDWRGQLSAIRRLATRPHTLVEAFRGRHTNNLGLAAQEKGFGFRLDGSFDYATTPASNWNFIDRESPPVHQRVREATGQFVAADHLSHERLAEFRAAIATLLREGVVVVGFLPPFSTESYNSLVTTSTQAQIFREYREGLPRIFAELGAPLFDATALSSLGLDDRYMYDGMHGMETLHLHLLKRLLDDPRVSRALPRTSDAVRAALAHPTTDFWFVGGDGDSAR